MVSHPKTGAKCSPKAYAQHLLAEAVQSTRDFGVNDQEMSAREVALTEAQLHKIADRMLSKLVKADAEIVESEEE